jgi:hypothetical protein
MSNARPALAVCLDRSKALAETFTSLSKLQKLKLSFSSNSNEAYAHIHPPGHGLLSLAEICGSIPGRLKVLRMTFLACYLPKLYLEVRSEMLVWGRKIECMHRKWPLMSI